LQNDRGVAHVNPPANGGHCFWRMPFSFSAPPVPQHFTYSGRSAERPSPPPSAQSTPVQRYREVMRVAGQPTAFGQTAPDSRLGPLPIICPLAPCFFLPSKPATPVGQPGVGICPRKRRCFPGVAGYVQPLVDISYKRATALGLVCAGRRCVSWPRHTTRMLAQL